MDLKKGKIGVSVDNIFPVIRQYLYSDQEIFLREIVANGQDAIQKFKALAISGSEELPDYKDEDLKVTVTLDEENGILTVSDHGIGMTADEVDKYINQIAFSSAQSWIEEHKDTQIIGHFGLGFFSAFMPSKQVEIVTRSYKKDAEAVRWSCNGDTEFTIEPATRDEFGTDVILHLTDEAKEDYGTKSKIDALLKKYCRFLPVPVVFGKKTKWDSEQKKNVDTDEDNVITSTAIWNQPKSELKDDDYKAFYRTLYPGEPEPLFWIRLDASEPFELRGVLYFPKTKDKNFVLNKKKISLYCNNVFVTDDMDGIGILPNFMDLLFGAIDSPDIPLNVSRSYLQSNRDVKRISSYITKKVADKLKEIFRDDRKRFEGFWDDLAVFVNYGMISEDSFYDKAKDFALFKNTDGKYFSYDEYKTLVQENQKDKNDKLHYLYTTNTDEQSAYITAAKNKGYDVLVFNEQHLDLIACQTLESKLEVQFSRVDAEPVDKLIDKGGETESVSNDDKVAFRGIFQEVTSKVKGCSFNVDAEYMPDYELPIVISQSEWMRRMHDNSKFQRDSWAMNMGDQFTMTLNASHDIVKQLLADAKEETKEEYTKATELFEEKKKAVDEINERLKDVKWEDRSQEDKDAAQKAEEEQWKADEERMKVWSNWGKENKIVSQLVDIAMLGAGKLNGDALVEFLKRTVSFIKK